jgi:hypothetical protein
MASLLLLYMIICMDKIIITLENQSDDLKYSNIPAIEVFCSIKERTVATFRRGTV